MFGALAIFMIALPASILEPTNPTPVVSALTLGLSGVFTACWALLYLVCGFGLLALRNWARLMALLLALPMALLVPFGTVGSALTWWYLTRPEVAEVFRTRQPIAKRKNSQGAAEWFEPEGAYGS
ncbi:MAG: hypothetical protein HC915_19205 [Anaerolineae bacterium]|nr:hypothetical protein [Anaerolineae bacterium]